MTSRYELGCDTISLSLASLASLARCNEVCGGLREVAASFLTTLRKRRVPVVILEAAGRAIQGSKNMLLIVRRLLSIIGSRLFSMAYDPLKIFAENIRRRRLALTWSQERLAHEAKLDRTYIGAVEREERNITLRSAQRIALALGSNLWELLMPHG